MTPICELRRYIMRACWLSQRRPIPALPAELRRRSPRDCNRPSTKEQLISVEYRAKGIPRCWKSLARTKCSSQNSLYTSANFGNTEFDGDNVKDSEAPLDAGERIRSHPSSEIWAAVLGVPDSPSRSLAMSGAWEDEEVRTSWWSFSTRN